MFMDFFFLKANVLDLWDKAIKKLGCLWDFLGFFVFVLNLC